MSNAICLAIKVKIDTKNLPKILSDIYLHYKGYFSELNSLNIGVYDGWGNEIVKDLDISDKNFNKIPIDQLPNKWEIGLGLVNQGYVYIIKGGEGDSFNIGIGNIGYFNKVMLDEMLKFAKVVCNFIDADAFVMREELGNFFDYKNSISFEMLGAKTEKEIVDMIKNSITKKFNLSDKEILKEIKQNTNGFKRFNKDLLILNLISLHKMKGKYWSKTRNKFCESIEKYGKQK